MSYDVYWVKNRAEKIADFEHPTSCAYFAHEALRGIIYLRIHVGLSTLLVSTNRAMRRPSECGTSGRLAPRSLLYVYSKH